MDVKVGDGVTSTIDGVKINYKNNTNNYKASQPDNITTTSVTVFGTQANVDAVTADSIYVYVDMTGAKPGLQDFTLQVDQPSGGLVKYSLVSNTYTLNVLGETNSDTTETNSGTGTE
jgi:hypothetical protein